MTTFLSELVNDDKLLQEFLNEYYQHIKGTSAPIINRSSFIELFGKIK